MGAPMMFAVIVPNAMAASFPGGDPLVQFVGKTLCVTGDVTKNSFTGGPQIIITDPSQIKVK
jgi:hypothetical protein